MKPSFVKLKSHGKVMRGGLMLWGLALLVIFPGAARSQDDLRARADAAWALREDPAQILVAIDLYEKCAARDPDNKEVRILLARATDWFFQQDPEMDKSQAVRILDKGVKACKEILAKNEDDMEANYWLMWTMADRTYSKGILSGFAFKEALVGSIMVAKSDIGYQYGGTYCYWGLVINSIPGLLGKFFHFSNDDAIWLYKRAIAVEPRYLRNHFYLGATYHVEGMRDEALKEYSFCVNQPDGALPEAIPENLFYKRMAREAITEL